MNEHLILQRIWKGLKIFSMLFTFLTHPPPPQSQETSSELSTSYASIYFLLGLSLFGLLALFDGLRRWL